MVLTTHALTGAVIGKNLNNPFLIIVLSIIIHYAMDHLRHGEYLNRKSALKNTWWKVLIDFSIGQTIIILITLLDSSELDNQRVFNIYAGVFFSMFPDLFTALYWKLDIKQLKFLFNFHANIHKYPQNAPERIWNFRNARNDILISILAIATLLSF